MTSFKSFSLAIVAAALAIPLTSQAAEPAHPLRSASAAEVTVLQNCLSESTGGNGVASADKLTGNLDRFKTCISNAGYTFNGNTDWWVTRVNEYCAKDGTVVFGIGNDHNAYKACLSNRGVEPTLYTVHTKYIAKVNEHCWGEDPVLERVLSVLTIWGVEAATPKPISRLQDFANFVGTTVQVAETGFDVQAYFDYLNHTSLPDLIDDMLPPNIYDIPPRALSNYASYKQCLTERNVKGLEFKPMHTQNDEQLRVWSGMVNSYCYGQIVQRLGNTDWSANTYKQCLRERAYPEQGLDLGLFKKVRSIESTVQWRGHVNCEYRYDMTDDPKGYLACLSRIGVGLHPDHVDDINGALKTQCNNAYPSAQRGANAAQYRACLAAGNVALTPEETAVLNSQIKTHCDNSYYTGGRFADYNAYFKCYTERGITFTNDATWQNGVKNYCADSNMGVGRLPGFQTCSSQRQVGYDAGFWQGKVATHCDGSYYTGGKFADYNAYWNCFKERGTSYINNGTWQSGVRNYCAHSNVATGGYNGNNTCLSQRQVGYSSGEWCPVVRSYCASQSYPFAWAGYTQARCVSERKC